MEHKQVWYTLKDIEEEIQERMDDTNKFAAKIEDLFSDGKLHHSTGIIILRHK